MAVLGWLNGFKRRKKHEILGSPYGAVEGYPIKIRVYAGTGTDTYNEVYLGGNVKPDFSDIRFTDETGIQKIPYWVEEVKTGEYADVWVKIPHIPANPDKATVFLYYDNPDATDESNQFLTGIAQVRTHKVGGTSLIKYSVANSKAKIDSTQTAVNIGHGLLFFNVKPDWLNGKVVEWTWNGWYETSQRSPTVASARVYDGKYNRKYDGQFPDYESELYLIGYGKLQTLKEVKLSNQTSWGPYNEAVAVSINPAMPDVTLFFMLLDDDGDFTMYLEIDRIKIGDFEIHFDSETVVMERSGTSTDYGLIRKKVDPEPTNDVWYPEELKRTTTYLNLEVEPL